MSAGLEVVAVGARTPVGLYAESTAAAVRGRISRVGDSLLIGVDKEGDPLGVAADPMLDPMSEGTDRLRPLARSAVQEVVSKLGPVLSRVTVEVLLVVPDERPGFEGATRQQLVRLLTADLRELVGANATFVVAGDGHAGVAVALERALRSNDRNVVHLVVGVDTFHHSKTLLWLLTERLFGPEARTGFVPGEGAGCLAIASTVLVKQLGLQRLASIRNVGTAQEPADPDSDAGVLGVGLAQALRTAFAGTSLPDEAADTIYADVNGERYRSEEWGFVALRFPSAVRHFDYEAPATSWGDVGAATGALAVVLAVQSWARGYARGPRALITTGSRDGLRGAILLEDPNN